MYRNEIFELIRVSQIEDNLITKGEYHECYRCDETCDIYIRAYDKDEFSYIIICKDCFCSSHNTDYCLPFSMLGEGGYIKDDIGTDYWWEKYKGYYGLEKCFNCDKTIKYGIGVYLRENRLNSQLERHYLCENCFKSQTYVCEEIHINWFKKKGIKVFNESKQKSRK